jgi:hypothetical protein
MSGDGNPLVPAKAGIQTIPSLPTSQGWIAAFAAMSGDKHLLTPAKVRCAVNPSLRLTLRVNRSLNIH